MKKHKQVIIHHTVPQAKESVEFWQSKPPVIDTHFIIKKDGMILHDNRSNRHNNISQSTGDNK